MTSLQGNAELAQDSIRTLERMLSSSRAEWNDSTRQVFDQRHGEAIIASGRDAARALQALARELDFAVALLN